MPDEADKKTIFQTLEKLRLSDEAANQILRLIKDGKLRVGDKLPSERQLVQDLGISRLPLREALRKLEEKGLIQVHPGRGAFIIRNPNEIKSDINFREWLWENRDRVFDLLEVREALEQEAANYAAQRASGEDLKSIESILKKTKHAVDRDELEVVIRCDQEFHISISKASKNEFFPYLVEQLTNILYEYRLSSLRLPQSANKSLNEHKRIFAAIKKNDPAAAKQAVLDHFERVREEVSRL